MWPRLSWDIAVEPTGATWTVPRSRGGLRRLQEQLQALRPTRIVLEASGGYERLVVASLAAAGLPVVRVNPRQTHAVARALGRLAKDRPAGRPGPGPLRRRGAAAAAPPAQRRGRGPADLEPPAPPTGGGSRGRPAAAPPRPQPSGSGLRPRGRCADGGPGPGGAPAGRAGGGGADAAGARHLAAEHPGHRPPWPPPPCWPTCPNWAPAPASRSPPWSGWRPSTATAAPGAGGAAAGAAAPGAQCALHGRADGHPPQPPHPRLLPALIAAGKPAKVALVACLRKLLVLCNALCRTQTTWDPTMP